MSPLSKVTAPLLALLLLAAVGLAGCGGAKAPAVKYHCPMHPDYISDRPGDCPICGMRLVPIEPAAATATAPAGRAAPPAAATPPPGQRKILFYRSPMNPQVTSPTPAKDEMGMNFVPVYADEAASGAGAVPGHAPMDISAAGLALAGVQVAAAAEGRLGENIRTVGQVVPNETEIHHIHTKVAGWIDKLFVDFTGQFVRQGAPVLSIYSPELLASQEEYLRAKAAAERFAASSLPEVRKGGEELVAAARRRLELLDAPPELLAELDRTSQPRKNVLFLAPRSGFVSGKGAFEGQQIDPSMDLFTIIDLSRIWIEAQLYEDEASAVRLGQPAHLTSPYDPALSLHGRVAYIDPFLDPASRTLKVRFDFPNPGLKLKPAMFVNVELELSPREGLVIPDSAVVDSGVRQIVFVDRGGGHFEPREVKVGMRSDGRALVLSGLAPGEQVAIRANFLLDSESRLRAAIAGMKPAVPTPPGPREAGP